MNSLIAVVVNQGGAIDLNALRLHWLVIGRAAIAIFLALTITLDVLYGFVWWSFWITVIVEGFNNANSH